MALDYVQKEKEIAALIESLDGSHDLDEASKARIRKLLDAGGARTALGISLS